MIEDTNRPILENLWETVSAHIIECGLSYYFVILSGSTSNFTQLRGVFVGNGHIFNRLVLKKMLTCLMHV